MSILGTSDKTLEILQIATTWPGYTVKEISEECGESVQTTQNHLDTLLKWKMLEKQPKGNFTPGIALACYYHLSVNSRIGTLEQENEKQKEDIRLMKILTSGGVPNGD